MMHPKLVFVFVLLFVSAFATGKENPVHALVVNRYDLQYRLDLDGGRLDATAKMRVKNIGDRPATIAPFLLYRLLRVTEVRMGGTRAPFTQEIVAFRDEPTLQANLIHVQTRLTPGAEGELTIAYSGHLLGYQEVMGYVRDRIDPEYSLLRNDSLAYPVLSGPSFAAMIEALRHKFAFTVRTITPPNYEVACGDSEIQRIDPTTVICTSREPNDRIDVAVAKFNKVEDRASAIKVFAIQADAARAEEILSEVKRVSAFYSEYLGPATGHGYTVVEIPEGWGSQASLGYILQTQPAFRDPARISELYHEVGHSWNANPAPEIQRTRFFDEAFATYFAALATKKFSGDQAFAAAMNRSRVRFREQVAKDARNGSTAIVDYGKFELGGSSYTKGAWALYVLHQAIGEQAFRRSMQRLLREYIDRPVTFEQFLQLCREESGHDLDRFAREWFFGTDSTAWMVGDADVKALAATY